MLDDAQLKALAEELDRSEKTRDQLGHFSRRFPDMTIDDGYRVQREWIKLKRAQGRTVKGHKIGLTSRAMQQASEITEPDYGVLLDDMFIPESGDIPRSRFIAPLQTEPKRGALTSAGSSRSLPAYSFVNWAKAVVTGCSLLACQGSLVISASKERTGRMASNKRSRTTEARLGGLPCWLALSRATIRARNSAS